MQVVILILAIAFIVVSTAKFKLHPFLALILAAIGYGLFSGMPLDTIIKSVNNGFGNTVGSIGIVIIAGCIIGTFLEKSGGAYVMAKGVMKLTGEKRVPLAMLLLGYFISIPVYADSAFVILSPLNKAMSRKAKITLAASAIALGLGLTITHCLVPPTPGPISAAGIMGADLGLVILTGIAASVMAVVIALFFVTKVASKTYINPGEDDSNDIMDKVKKAPSVTKSFIPVVIPLVLIVLKSISDFPTEPFGSGTAKMIISFIGEPVIALLIGLALALTLPDKLNREMLSITGWVGESLTSAAIIIMITAAGGSFGMILRDSGIANILGDALAEFNLGIWLPFIIAAALKTAQGSSTVAIITTASLVAPLMGVLGFETAIAKALAVTSICSGAMVISHVNDSFFWVVTQMTGMSVNAGCKLHSVGTLLCGLGSMITVWLMFVLFC